MDNNQYLISLPGIPANALGKEYNFTMNVGDEQVFDLKISGLAYVNLVFEYGNPDDVTKQALIALYNYAQTAENYQSSN